MYVVLAGDMIEGESLKVYGPFEDHGDADEFCQMLDTISWIKDLHEPQP